MSKEDTMAIKKFFFIPFVLTLLFLAAVLTVEISSAAAGGPETETGILKIEKIKKAGKLIVGTSADYPPYEFHLLNEKEGDLVGIDIDIARAIANELGVELEIKDLVFSRIFETLASGNIDIAIAGLHPTEDRKKVVNFSDIYLMAIQSLLIRKENSDRIKTIEDLRGKKVGVQRESLQESMARSAVSSAEFVVRDTIEELIIILSKNIVDTVILEEPVADSYTLRHKDFLSIKLKQFDYLLGSAIAVRKGDDDLLKEVNRILAKLKSENKIDEFVTRAKILTNKH